MVKGKYGLLPMPSDDDNDASYLLVTGYIGSTTPAAVRAWEEGHSLLACTDITKGRWWRLLWEHQGNSAIIWAKAKSSGGWAGQGRTKPAGWQNCWTSCLSQGLSSPASVPDGWAAAPPLPGWYGCAIHTCTASVSFLTICSGLDLSTSLLFTLNFNVQMAFTYKWPFLHPRHSRSSIA